MKSSHTEADKSVCHKALRLLFSALLSFALFSGTVPLHAQNFGYRLQSGKKKVSIPFELHNNLIVLPVLLNDSLPLKFILDTGIGTSILSEALFAEMQGLKYDRVLSVTGPGSENNEVTAYMVRSVRLTLPGIDCLGVPLYVLAEDYLKLQDYMGTDVHGILGGDIFTNFVVDIDYESKIITFIEPAKFKPRRNFRQIPFELKNNKPYVETYVQSFDGAADTLSMLLDLGASHAILIDMGSETHIKLPEKTIYQSIGRGIAGVIPGYVGRLAVVNFAGNQFKEVIATFSYAYTPEYLLDSLKNGSIGGDLLSRYHLVLNYSASAMYLLRNNQINNEFSFNMSGLEVTATGPDFKIFKISAVRESSEAEAAGIRPGDEILVINGVKSEALNLTQVNAMLRERNNRKINMKLKREKTKFNVQFRLKNLI